MASATPGRSVRELISAKTSGSRLKNAAVRRLRWRHGYLHQKCGQRCLQNSYF
ncbi:hypothetical protein M5D96_003147 [Drosophila gunungcola]|uniref:Uncharacterized protein n=1 Tax=Drosophila gunungcola TaxID=103775 RepID=A0A9Q0BWA4_9MUSC|nr:hypothetical protein M5D96_003147 [Drosophila gunungcola]